MKINTVLIVGLGLIATGCGEREQAGSEPAVEAAAGPATDILGTSQTLWILVALIVLPTVAVLFVPEVRNLRSQPEPR